MCLTNLIAFLTKVAEKIFIIMQFQSAFEVISTHKIAENIEKLKDSLREKVIQYQIPVFSDGTKRDLILRFDDVIADALELGALRREPIPLTEEQEQWLAEVTPKSVPLNVTRTLLEYYIANKPSDSEWSILPITNIKRTLAAVRRSGGSI